MPLLDFAKPEKNKENPIKKLGEFIMPLASKLLDQGKTKGE